MKVSLKQEPNAQHHPNPVEYADSLSYLRQWEYVTQEHAAGANLFTWRKVFDEVGLFDERLLNLGDKD